MAPIISIRNINKTFGVVTALDQLSLDIEEGTFHAIMGENGAGKSTIAKCVMGLYPPDSGDILIRGEKVEITHPKVAHQYGIGMVYQHFMLVDNMTVAENLTLVREPLPMLFNWRKEKEMLQVFMNSMPFKLDLNARVRDLSAGEKQKLEILKMLFLGARILILDEPTSVLTPGEADSILSFLKASVSENKFTVIMITHKFREVFAYADDLSVLRKGRYVGGGRVADFSSSDIATMMVSEHLREVPTREVHPDSIVKMEVVDLVDQDELSVTVLNHVNLQVKAGEIYGIAGVSGNGQKRLVEILAGQRSPGSGKVLIDGKAFVPRRKSIYKARFHCLPEEPLRNACVPDMSVAENMALHYYDRNPFQKNNVVNRKSINRKAAELIDRFNVKTPSPETPIKFLSGGNIQRAVLARELSENAAVLIVSNPCFGLDFSATADVHALLLLARNNGTAILLLSEDLDEVIGLSDRIGVMFNGAIVYETSASAVNINIIGEKMAGN